MAWIPVKHIQFFTLSCSEHLCEHATRWQCCSGAYNYASWPICTACNIPLNILHILTSEYVHMLSKNQCFFKAFEKLYFHFVWKAPRKEIFHLLLHFPNFCQEPRLDQRSQEPRTQLGIPTWCQGIKSSSVVHQGDIDKKLERKWRSQDLKQAFL